jgi:hypothetical protein
MKLKRLLVIILVTGLLAAYYILGTDYGAQRRQKAALASQITVATQQLAQIPPPPTDLDTRLAAASAELDTVQNAFPGQLNSTLIVNAILKLAEETGVKAVPMVTQPWSTESVNEIDYPVFRLNVAIKGTFAQLADFLSRLENGEPGTLVITDFKVDRITGPPADEGETDDAAPVDASLDIAVYARPGVPELSPKGGK